MSSKREHSPEALEAFDAVRDALQVRPEISRAQWFGIPAAKVSGAMFVALRGDALVVKLGAEDVDRRVAASEGERFDPSGKGRAMKDWLQCEAPSSQWLALAEAALAFVMTQQ